MIDRRALLTGAAALVAAPQIAAAQQATQPAASGGFQLPPELQPQTVRVRQQYAPGQIFVLPRSHFLYLITEPGLARRYGVGVGQAGLDFQGEAVIQVKKEWPTWRPTDEMIERSPDHYGKFKDSDYVQPGGPTNPLGARALYLFKDGRDTYYRIHGTTEPESIGRSVSNGCIRMLNAHVKDLYERVPVGTKVTVF